MCITSCTYQIVVSLLVDIVLFLSYQISDCSSKKKTVCSWLILRIEKGKSAEVYFGNNIFFFRHYYTSIALYLWIGGFNKIKRFRMVEAWSRVSDSMRSTWLHGFSGHFIHLSSVVHESKNFRTEFLQVAPF